MLHRWEQLGLIDEILSGVRKSLTLDPTDPSTRLLLLQLLAQRHKSSEFLTELERLTTGDVGVLYRLGNVLSNSGQSVEGRDRSTNPCRSSRTSSSVPRPSWDARTRWMRTVIAEAIEAWRRSVS